MGSFRSQVIARKKLEAMVAGAKLARAHVTGEPLEGEEMLVGSGDSDVGWGKSS